MVLAVMVTLVYWFEILLVVEFVYLMLKSSVFLALVKPGYKKYYI